MSKSQTPVFTISAMNDWFLSLPPEHQAVLREDKWRLAEAAFAAGREAAGPLIGYRYVARREKDGSSWSEMFFENGGCAFAHDRKIKRALHAKSLKELQGAMFNQLCSHGQALGPQAQGRYSIWKVANGRVAEVVVEGYVPGQAFFFERPFGGPGINDISNFRQDAYWEFVGEVNTLKRDVEGLGVYFFATGRRSEDLWVQICSLARWLKLELQDEAYSGVVDEKSLTLAIGDFLASVEGGVGEVERIRVEGSRTLLILANMLRKRAADDGITFTHEGYNPSAVRMPITPVKASELS